MITKHSVTVQNIIAEHIKKNVQKSN